MKTVAILILIGVISIAVFGLTAGQTAVNRYYDDQAQPVSAVDTVMRSRQTPPVAPEPTNRWAAVVFPLVALFVVGTVFGILYFGERFLKQWRILTKKNKPRAVAYLPAHPQSEWGQLPGVRPVTPLPAPQEHSNEAH
jgi:hypothetical protein